MQVVGYDLDAEKVRRLQEGASYLGDVSDRDVRSAWPRLMPTVDAADLRDSDAIIISVQSPLRRDGAPDLAHVERALDTVATLVNPGTLIVLQSTVPPGTAMAAAAQIAVRTGLAVGQDVFVAVAPERIDPGNKLGWNVANTPRVVGGVTVECTRRAVALFAAICDHVVPVANATTAETTKVFENTFRLVNIALIYELAAICDDMGISVNQVVDAAASKPFGFLAHRVGAGIGGECIPVDPAFFRHHARTRGLALPLIGCAYDHALRRPHVVAERVVSTLAERGVETLEARVLLAGVSYKPGVADLRNAPGLTIMKELRDRGIEVSFSDPCVDSVEIEGEAQASVAFAERAVAEYDCVVLVTPHPQLVGSGAWAAAPLVVDACHVLPRADGVVRV
jgi:UDP-N-acetyl-D-glucosamine dehydrogenase